MGFLTCSTDSVDLAGSNHYSVNATLSALFAFATMLQGHSEQTLEAYQRQCDAHDRDLTRCANDFTTNPTQDTAESFLSTLKDTKRFFKKRLKHLQDRQKKRKDEDIAQSIAWQEAIDNLTKINEQHKEVKAFIQKCEREATAKNEITDDVLAETQSLRKEFADVINQPAPYPYKTVPKNICPSYKDKYYIFDFKFETVILSV